MGLEVRGKLLSLERHQLRPLAAEDQTRWSKDSECNAADRQPWQWNNHGGDYGEDSAMGHQMTQDHWVTALGGHWRERRELAVQDSLNLFPQSLMRGETLQGVLVMWEREGC